MQIECISAELRRKIKYGKLRLAFPVNSNGNHVGCEHAGAVG